MTTYLLRFDPDLRLAGLWAEAEKLAPRDDCDDGYVWHALLCAAFGKGEAPKPFRLLSRRGRPAQLLAYSQTSGEDLAALAQSYADPKAFSALGVETLAGKAMPDFSAGRRLGFSIKLRPVVRADRDGDRRKTREIDVLVHARESGDQREKEEIYLDWTRRRLEAVGVEIEALRLDGLEGVNVARRGAVETGAVERGAVERGGRALRSIPGHAIGVAGVLRIVAPEAFNAALARGVGRHRAFGFGMLLLSPPEV